MKKDCSTCVRGGVGGDLCLSCKSETYENWENCETKINNKRPAATPEPPPAGKGAFVLSEVLKDLCARADMGFKKYGTMLRTNNGRDALMDAYQERLDELMYFKQALMEREQSLEERIVQWAKDRGLYEKGSWVGQFNKVHEEILEWQNSMLKEDKNEEMLELGDIYVVLVNLAKIRGFSLEQCGWAAYDKIKNRTGRMENGTFVKDDGL